MFDQLRQP
jgi:phenylalanyl-tRNA synthetase beta chain